ncbi:hypothetical protein H2204_009806 [Knufia peltigerae]|uniref:Uncharacterized protein n=1 Tax=Knufia peltigerae TaxID=1002370 RepID=A0AA38XXD7_9EURO|nr:hypothetical protein H2204_009806 [Knufia peltigerae]
MPDIERRRPRVATVEDWDEEAQTTLPGSRTSANVAIKRSQQELSALREQKSSHDGFDSGYVSRADTLVSESSTLSRRKMPELKLDTAAVPERARQPYHVPFSAPGKPVSRRKSGSHSKEVPVDQLRPAKAKSFVHQPGACWVCDQYGKHIDIKQEMSRASSVAPPPPSSKTTRQTAPRSAKDDDALPVRSRRVSTSRQPRPLSMMPQAIPLQYMSYGPPVATSGWGTPITPSIPYNSVPYAYPPPSPMPGTSFAPFPQMPPYMDVAPPSEPHSARASRRSSPARRSSTYGDPVIRQTYADTGTTNLEKVSSKENRPVLTSRRSSRVMDEDRISMPPPPPPPPQPKPQPSEVVLVRRPSARRSKTYHPTEAPLRERFYEPDDDFDVPDSRPPLSPMRSRRESHSPSRPPTSYRGPSNIEARDRPGLPRKSVSYSTPTATTKVASSKAGATPRRTTMPSSIIPLEQKELEAEQYQNRRSKTSSELTAEALRDLNKRNSSSRSETGSSYSHKSHQSSSKDSSGRGRSHTSGTRTSITLPGGLNIGIPTDYMDKEGRPLSISVGGLVLSVGTEGKEVPRVREQKRIERAPSEASRASRKSMSSNMSSRDPVHPSRRLSHIEDRVPSLKSSAQPSRAPSVNGRGYDYRRQSVDYGKNIDDAVYGA